MTGSFSLRRQSKRTHRRQQPLRGQALEHRLVLACMIQGGSYDFGDLPDTGYGTSVNNYQTLGLDNGPSHANAGPRLGTWRDPDLSPQPDINAVGDDICHPDAFDIDDEDGITFPTTMIRDPNTSTTGSFYLDLQMADSTSNKLDAWIDFNQDGDFSDTGEQIFDTYSLGTTSQKLLLNFTIPAGPAWNPGYKHFGRFRLSTQGGLSPQFFFWDGEVEDYVIPLKSLAYADLVVDMQHIDSDEVTLSTSGTDLVIESDGETLLQAPLASAKSLTVEGVPLVSQTVVVDVTGNVPVPSGGLTINLPDYYANPNFDPDEVHIVGTLDSSLAPSYRFTSIDDGYVEYFDGTTLKHRITVTDVETVADVSSGTGLIGTIKRDTSAQDLRLRTGFIYDGKPTTKITSDYVNIPRLHIGEKSLQITTGAAVDLITVESTVGLDGLTITTAGSYDIVSILSVEPATDVNVFTEDGNDLVYLGVEYGTSGVNSSGTLSNILGSVNIDTGSNLVGYVDVINIRDMSATAAQTYGLSSSLLTRTAGAIEIGMANLERIDFRTSDHGDTVTVNDTDDLTSFYLETNGSNDIISVLAIDSMTEAEISTKEQNDLFFLGVEYPHDVNTSGDLTPIAGSLLIDGGTNSSGYSDALNIRDIDASANHVYGFDSTGFTRDASVAIELANIEWVDLRTGSGNDTISNDVAYAVGFCADGGSGHDTITGGAGVDTLIGGHGNDILDGAGGDDQLYLGTGADTAYGGTGDDYFNVGNYDAAVDSLFGDDGSDLVVGVIDGLDVLTDIETDSRG